MDPVADFQHGGATAAMESGRTDHDVVQENAEHDVSTSFPFGGPLIDKGDARVDALRLSHDPRHPWAEVVEVLLDRGAQCRRVVGNPTTQRPSLGCNRLGQSVHPLIVTYPSACPNAVCLGRSIDPRVTRSTRADP